MLDSIVSYFLKRKALFAALFFMLASLAVITWTIKQATPTQVAEVSPVVPSNVYSLGSCLKNDSQKEANSPPPLARMIVKEFDGVAAATRLFSEKSMPGHFEGNAFIESNIYTADPEFFDVFGVDLLLGDKKTALKDAQAVVMTESCAKRYFGTKKPPAGTTFMLDHKAYSLAGVMADTDARLPVKFDMLISMASRSGMEKSSDWSWNVVSTYLRLDENTSADALLEQLPNMVEKYARPYFGDSFDQWLRQGGHLACSMRAV